MVELSRDDHDLVTAAVTAAERVSAGEVVTIVADQSDSYHDVGLHFAVLAMLLVPLAFAAAPQSWIDWAVGYWLGWNAEPSRSQIMVFLFAKLTAVFLIVRFLLAIRPLRMALTPRRTKTRRVRRRAIVLFRAACEMRTRGRTGVLVYLSLAERRAEIVADRAITDKVDDEVWGEAMAALLAEVKAGRPGEGLAKAVEQIGAVLAEILPPTADNPNELGDRLVTL
jgi:putative membrane protein